MVDEKAWQELEEQLGMGRELCPEAVRYRVIGPAGARVATIPVHPEVAVKPYGVPSAGTVVGETEQPESVTSVVGPEFATVIRIISWTFAAIENDPWLPVLLPSPW